MSRYLLDTTALIAHLRGDGHVTNYLLGLLADGHTLATTCVNIAELERGLRGPERKAATALVDRLEFLVTGREAAQRAGRYQADFGRRGRTIHTADALVAGTARAHGAVLVTDNVGDFPMRDLTVESPPAQSAP
ncbi:MAG: PIN domain-containing protein [Actinomycetota bacterium]|nr:PIN domain-containing protein [Actinomycetota bacterium]